MREEKLQIEMHRFVENVMKETKDDGKKITYQDATIVFLVNKLAEAFTKIESLERELGHIRASLKKDFYD